MPRAISRCPSCGQTATPFAAGCAVCGADLEAARAQLAARRRLELPRPRWFDPQPGLQWPQIVVVFLLALFAPPFGLLLALYWAYQHNQARDTTMTVVMLAAVALAAAALIAPVWFWRHLY